MEDMGMTDNQWKDFLRGYKEDLEELDEFHRTGETERFEKKCKICLIEFKRAQKVKSRKEQTYVICKRNKSIDRIKSGEVW